MGLLEPLIHLLYPPLCLHCRASLDQPSSLLCSLCFEQMSLLETKGRCLRCFDPLNKGLCGQCIGRKAILRRQMAACERMGAASTILTGIVQGNRKCILAAASLMAYQWLEQNQLIADLLIPLPIPFWQRLRQGTDVNLELAKEVSQIFSAPQVSMLKATFDSHHFLTSGQFQCRFEVNRRKAACLCDQKILLIAPVLNDELFRRAAEELSLFFPGQIDGLSFVSP